MNENKYARILEWPPEPACLGCVHYRKICDNGDKTPTGRACHYLIDTGTLRGCPMGEGCKRKEVDPDG